MLSARRRGGAAAPAYGRWPVRVRAAVLSSTWCGGDLHGRGLRDLIVVGMSHRTAPLEVASGWPFPREALRRCCRGWWPRAVAEALALSKCNRVGSTRRRAATWRWTRWRRRWRTCWPASPARRGGAPEAEPPARRRCDTCSVCGLAGTRWSWGSRRSGASRSRSIARVGARGARLEKRCGARCAWAARAQRRPSRGQVSVSSVGWSARGSSSATSPGTTRFCSGPGRWPRRRRGCWCARGRGCRS